MADREYDYPYYGQQPWYAILLQDKFLSCFTDESYYLSTAGRKHDYFSALRKEFSEIVNGMTIACAMSNSEKWKSLSDDYFDFSPIYGIGFYHYMKTCPKDPRYFSTIWHTMDNLNKTDPEKLCAEQIAVLIFYPFWHRMGLNDEENFIRSGRLGKYLQILQSKTVLPKQRKNERKPFWRFLRNK